MSEKLTQKSKGATIKILYFYKSSLRSFLKIVASLYENHENNAKRH
jgi:hypothetical protein